MDSGFDLRGLLAYTYDWDIFFRSVFAPDGLIIRGVLTTIYLAVISQTLGVGLGTLAALGRMSRRGAVRSAAAVYIWIFRGTPLLVQLTFLYFGLSVAGIFGWPEIVIGEIEIPGRIQAAIVALALNEGAYMAEIVRAGILSVPAGQMEAAKSLGMPSGMAMRRIVLPQAARVIVPPLGNEFNNMLKTTSLVVTVGAVELYATFQNKNASGSTSFHPFELFLAAAVWYLLLTTIWQVIQAWIERRVGRGTRGDEGPSLTERLLGSRLGRGPMSAETGGR
jgi:polar amino acid transport system permease protein